MIKKEVFIGFIIGILSTVIGVIITTIIFSFFQKLSFISTFEIIKEQNRLWALLALGAIPSQIAFFVLLNKKKDYRARGIVLSTFLVAFIVYYLYFS